MSEVSALPWAAAPGADVMVCRYADGIGHPFWFSRDVFSELSQLHGDKGVWKLVQSGRSNRT